MKADLLAQRSIAADSVADENNWWHTVRTMSEEDMELLPYSFMKKYGSFVKRMKEHELMVQTEESKAHDGRFEEIRGLYKLMTNEEKQAIEDFKATNTAHPENEIDNYEMTGYLTR